MELVDDRTTGTRERLPVAAPTVSGNQQTCGFHCGHEVLLHKRMRAQSLDCRELPNLSKPLKNLSTDLSREPRERFSTGP